MATMFDRTKTGGFSRRGKSHHCTRCRSHLGYELLNSAGQAEGITFSNDSEHSTQEFDEPMRIICWHCDYETILIPSSTQSSKA